MSRKDAILNMRQVLVKRRDALRKALAGDLSLLRELQAQASGDVVDAALDSGQDEISSLRAEVERRFVEAKEERKTLRAEMQALRAEMHVQFRWTIGLLFPLVAGMLAIIIRVFFVGAF